MDGSAKKYNKDEYIANIRAYPYIFLIVHVV